MEGGIAALEDTAGLLKQLQNASPIQILVIP